uniref:phenylalanine--tRNA ligase n=1 Tax=Echinococcus granulosus TaxID=6210 RepID=A0A068X1D7_ECHGR|nr:phenylalanyl tRNA synthetase [Echinococcus granulosus]
MRVLRLCLPRNHISTSCKRCQFSVLISSDEPKKGVNILGKLYKTDSWSNISPKILDLTARNLHNQEYHPLWLLKHRITEFINKRPAHQNAEGIGTSHPLFSVHDSLSPVVSTFQNFDSLLVTPDHVSRRPTDTYYINKHTVLRSHTSAHEMELIRSGLNAFVTVGDVYRRDDIDALHYPAFHQLEGVRLFTEKELFKDTVDPSGCLKLFEHSTSEVLQPLSVAVPSSELPLGRQPRHTLETAYCIEFQLKCILEELAVHLFGKDVPMRWVPAYFPFTHPSWELEIQTGVMTGADSDGWTEMLGCGILRQEIIDHGGVTNRVGYAFGLGLERWAMKLYSIPDIRLFWSRDPGFLHQFKVETINESITYKPISVFPPCPLDISFWLPYATPDHRLEFERDFFELVRGVVGDLVEQVTLIDRFEDKVNARVSYCYRIVYRDHSRTLTMREVRPLHEEVGRLAETHLNVKVR